MTGSSERSRTQKGSAHRGGGRRARASKRADGPTVTRGRSCVGCAEVAPIEAVRKADLALPEAEALAPLVRIVLGPGGEIAVDAGGHGGANDGGLRGAYVHASPACVKAAAQRGLARAAKSSVFLDGQPVTAGLLAAAIASAYRRRASGLLASAKRARALEIGADAVTVACRGGVAALVVVAADAQQAADLTEVRRYVAAGRAIGWPDKASLGDLTRGGVPQGVGVVAVTDSRIAAALRETSTIVGALSGWVPEGGGIGEGGGTPPRGFAGGSSGAPDEPESATSDHDRAGVAPAAYASIVHGWAARVRGSKDPASASSAFRAVEWSA